MKYPDSNKKRLVEYILGYKVADDYRWLENGNDQSVRKWSKLQNQLTDKVISKEKRDTFKKELRLNYKFSKVDPTFPYRGIYFWTERRQDQDQSVLYFRKGLNGKKRVLINPNKLSSQSGHSISLDYWFPSHSGKYIVYGTSQDGNEISELTVMEVSSGEDIEKVAKNASFAAVQWLPDEDAFYYTKHPDPGAVPPGDERYYQKVYMHKLGENPDKDKLIFGQDRPKEDMFSLELSVDGRQLV